MDFTRYDCEGFFDEIFEAAGQARAGAELLVQKLSTLPMSELVRRQKAAENAFMRMGITFNVYSDGQGTEKIFPFDLLPRVVEAKEWDWIERGLKQRISAL